MRDNWMLMEENPPPKDGTFFLAYTPAWNGNNPEERFDIVFWGDSSEGISVNSKIMMDWCVKDSYGDEQGGWETVKPTHWMRLERPHE